LKVDDIEPGGHAWVSAHALIFVPAGDGSHEVVDLDYQCSATPDSVYGHWLGRSADGRIFAYVTPPYSTDALRYDHGDLAERSRTAYAFHMVWKTALDKTTEDITDNTRYILRDYFGQDIPERVELLKLWIKTTRAMSEWSAVRYALRDLYFSNIEDVSGDA
jgi:hypothetical protein